MTASRRRTTGWPPTCGRAIGCSSTTARSTCGWSSVDGDDITCEVLQGGPVSNHKGISLPGVDVSVPPLSEKDIEDLKFALELGVDMVAMSFVRAPEEVSSRTGSWTRWASGCR